MCALASLWPLMFLALERGEPTSLLQVGLAGGLALTVIAGIVPGTNARKRMLWIAAPFALGMFFCAFVGAVEADAALVPTDGRNACTDWDFRGGGFDSPSECEGASWYEGLWLGTYLVGYVWALIGTIVLSARGMAQDR